LALILWKIGQNLPKSGEPNDNPSAILKTMYEEGVKYASNAIKTSVHKFFWGPSSPNQGPQQLAWGPWIWKIGFNLWKIGQNLPKSGERKDNPSAIL